MDFSEYADLVVKHHPSLEEAFNNDTIDDIIERWKGFGMIGRYSDTAEREAEAYNAISLRFWVSDVEQIPSSAIFDGLKSFNTDGVSHELAYMTLCIAYQKYTQYELSELCNEAFFNAIKNMDIRHSVILDVSNRIASDAYGVYSGGPAKEITGEQQDNLKRFLEEAERRKDMWMEENILRARCKKSLTDMDGDIEWLKEKIERGDDVEKNKELLSGVEEKKKELLEYIKENNIEWI